MRRRLRRRLQVAARMARRRDPRHRIAYGLLQGGLLLAGLLQGGLLRRRRDGNTHHHSLLRRIPQAVGGGRQRLLLRLLLRMLHMLHNTLKFSAPSEVSQPCCTCRKSAKHPTASLPHTDTWYGSGKQGAEQCHTCACCCRYCRCCC